jgi:hypothetical protein
MYGILRLGVGHASILATPEIAQFALGDLTFKVHNPHWTKRFAQKSSSLKLILRHTCDPSRHR